MSLSENERRNPFSRVQTEGSANVRSLYSNVIKTHVASDKEANEAYTIFHSERNEYKSAPLIPSAKYLKRAITKNLSGDSRSRDATKQSTSLKEEKSSSGGPGNQSLTNERLYGQKQPLFKGIPPLYQSVRGKKSRKIPREMTEQLLDQEKQFGAYSDQVPHADRFMSTYSLHRNLLHSQKRSKMMKSHSVGKKFTEGREFDHPLNKKALKVAYAEGQFTQPSSSHRALNEFRQQRAHVKDHSEMGNSHTLREPELVEIETLSRGETPNQAQNATLKHKRAMSEQSREGAIVLSAKLQHLRQASVHRFPDSMKNLRASAAAAVTAAAPLAAWKREDKASLIKRIKESRGKERLKKFYLKDGAVASSTELFQKHFGNKPTDEMPEKERRAGTELRTRRIAGKVLSSGGSSSALKPRISSGGFSKAQKFVQNNGVRKKTAYGYKPRTQELLKSRKRDFVPMFGNLLREQQEIEEQRYLEERLDRLKKEKPTGVVMATTSARRHGEEISPDEVYPKKQQQPSWRNLTLEADGRSEGFEFEENGNISPIRLQMKQFFAYENSTSKGESLVLDAEKSSKQEKKGKETAAVAALDTALKPDSCTPSFQNYVFYGESLPQSEIKNDSLAEVVEMVEGKKLEF